MVICSCGRSFRKQAHMEQHLRDLGSRHGQQRDNHPAPSTSSDLLYTLPSNLYDVDRLNLERFIAEKIQADDYYLSCCKSVIHELAEDLKGPNSPFRPREIIKSGSLGKGTSVKGKSDVDLIMMLNNHEDVEELMEEMPNVLGKLERFLRNNTRTTHKITTRFSVQVEMHCPHGHTHEVDILPGLDLIGMGKTTGAIYQQMGDVSDTLIHEYSVSLYPLQLEIIGQLPAKVKNLIRLVKYWKNEKLKGNREPERPSFAEKIPGKTAWPSSYALELVVMNAWIQAGKPVNFDMTRAIHSVLTSLVDHKQFRVLLHGLMKYDAHMARHGSGPYIMDPANPYNDMYHGLVNKKAFDWDEVAVKASEWLRSGLFAGLSSTKSRW